MNVVLNGTPTGLGEAPSIVDVVAAAGHEGGSFGIAVALNGEVVVRSAWPSTYLSEGDKVEVLVAAQGG